MALLALHVIKFTQMKIMKLLVTIGLILITYSYSFSQKNQLPEFIGNQNSFQNFILSELLKIDAVFSKTCDTSLGLIEFQITKDGKAKSVKISSNIPEEVRNELSRIVSASQWRALKATESLPIILPIYISIELGCNDQNYIKRNFGLEKDFREMLSISNNQVAVNCILLEPFTYVVPAGFQDLAPRKH